MSGKADGKTFNLRVARETANELIRILQPVVQQIAIAGSIRREVPRVHDIDLVAWPIYEEVGQMDLLGGAAQLIPTPLVEMVKKIADVTSEGIRMRPFKQDHVTIVFERYEIPVEIYLTKPDGSNWGAQLQQRTGSTAFNLRLVMEAHKLGLQYSAGYGIFEGDRRVDDDTEAGILRQIGISEWYLDPTRRLS
jgi:DNA polymerase/3'-5' exonuclease PolX